ncbi:MAG: 30S ribosomal protein S2 [Fimbriimonadales bacterium]|nr:MAG: 30S ribosomal protein S2 [Fimbriimonadales bacterium]
MQPLTMRELLEAGVHFGHATRKWDPRMKRYIYGARHGIYIIDLHQTIQLFNQAAEAIRDCVEDGGTVLFVGTKKQAAGVVRDCAQRCGMPYVSERWLGGLLTNWRTMQQRIQRLKELEKLEQEGYFQRLTKKEALMRTKEKERLRKLFEGVMNMHEPPDMIYIVDVEHEDLAVKEANRLKIPIVAIVDTNCNPDPIDYVIPGNDDAIRSVKLITGKIADLIAGEKSQVDGEEETSPGYELGDVELEMLRKYNIEDELEGVSSEDEETVEDEEVDGEETAEPEAATEEVAAATSEEPSDEENKEGEA